MTVVSQVPRDTVTIQEGSEEGLARVIAGAGVGLPRPVLQGQASATCDDLGGGLFSDLGSVVTPSRSLWGED